MAVFSAEIKYTIFIINSIEGTFVQLSSEIVLAMFPLEIKSKVKCFTHFVPSYG